jgi:hypothetical protein
MRDSNLVITSARQRLTELTQASIAKTSARRPKVSNISDRAYDPILRSGERLRCGADLHCVGARAGASFGAVFLRDAHVVLTKEQCGQDLEKNLRTVASSLQPANRNPVINVKRATTALDSIDAVRAARGH